MTTETKDRLFIAVLPATIILMTAINLLPSSLAIILIRENGPVETLSALLYFADACWLFWLSRRHRLRDGIASGFLVALLCLRELDFHTRFTSMGIFKSRYYLSPAVPAGEKLVVLAIVIALLVVAGLYCRRNLLPFLGALLASRREAVALAFALGTIAASKSLDSLSWPVDPIFELLSTDPITVLRTMEETLELAIPVYLFFSIWYFTSGQSGAQNNRFPAGGISN